MCPPSCTNSVSAPFPSTADEPRSPAVSSGESGCESDLLQWLVAERGALPAQPLLETVDAAGGRRLVALSDVAPGTVLLSLPLSSCFVDDEADDPELPWSARMGLRLLTERSAALMSDSCLTASTPGGAEGGKVGSGASQWGTWLAALPAHVDLPFVHWSAAEVAALAEPSVIRETEAMRQLLEDSFELLESELAAVGCGAAEWRWALSVLHSRSFLEGPAATHMVAPGIDMANHSDSPNAAVRCQHSPDACQGVEATEEVCEGGQLGPSRFELVAAPDGAHIRRGDEVTISYGRWPNDAFLLFFGFLPERNPHDTAALFDDLPDLADAAAALVDGPADTGARVSQQLAQSLPPGDYSRLLVTAEGFDGRLVQALAALQATCPHLPPTATGELLLRRCRALQDSLHVGVAQNGALEEVSETEDVDGHGGGERLETARRFRESKAHICAMAIASLTPVTGTQ